MDIKVFKFVVPIFLLALPLFFPAFYLSSDIGTFLTVISLLFAILVGFFISGATANYLRMRTLIANINASLIAIHNYSHIINAEQHSAVTKAVDSYLIATLDYDLLDFSGKAQQEFNDIIFLVDDIRSHDDIGAAVMQNLHNAKINLITNDEEIAITAKNIVSPEHWLILMILAGLIVILMLGLRDNGITLTLIIAVLNFAIYHILVLLYELDSSIFLARKLALQIPQRVFTAIGCLPYYPEYAMRLPHVMPSKKQSYRVGSFVGTGKIKRKIRTVNPKK